jgi:hypothetical protein
MAAIMFIEDDASKAAELIRDADLHAPRLLPFELAGVACK